MAVVGEVGLAAVRRHLLGGHRDGAVDRALVAGRNLDLQGRDGVRIVVRVGYLQGIAAAAVVDQRGASRRACAQLQRARVDRSEEHTSELQSLMRISYAVFCLKKK